MLGTATPMVFDDTVSVVKAVTRWLEFYAHESCGKCTPCREGTGWIAGTLKKFEAGQGTKAELGMLEDVCGQILGRSFCALGDAAATPFPAALKHFPDEFLAGTYMAADSAFHSHAATVLPEGALL
jgi:NADH-quinone oxidoreductase subunit F